MTSSGEVLLQALGEDAAGLHPEILAQLRSPGARSVARGVFAVAGSRFRWLTRLSAPIVGPEAVVSRHENHVPFTVVTTAGRDAQGRATLDTTREFRFRGGTQRITDRLVASSRPGLVRNLLGRSGRIELIERCDVTGDGALRMRTERIAVRLGGRRLALRGLLRLDVHVEDGWDAVEQRRTIRMRARSPLVGTVLEYRGWYRPAGAADRPLDDQ